MLITSKTIIQGLEWMGGMIMLIFFTSDQRLKFLSLIWMILNLSNNLHTHKQQSNFTTPQYKQLTLKNVSVASALCNIYLDKNNALTLSVCSML